MIFTQEGLVGIYPHPSGSIYRPTVQQLRRIVRHIHYGRWPIIPSITAAYHRVVFPHSAEGVQDFEIWTDSRA